MPPQKGFFSCDIIDDPYCIYLNFLYHCNQLIIGKCEKVDMQMDIGQLYCNLFCLIFPFDQVHTFLTKLYGENTSKVLQFWQFSILAIFNFSNFQIWPFSSKIESHTKNINNISDIWILLSKNSCLRFHINISTFGSIPHSKIFFRYFFTAY